MNRYLVFTFSTYYPSGGFNDFIGSATTKESAFAMADAEVAEYGDDVIQVIDSTDGEEVTI